MLVNMHKAARCGYPSARMDANCAPLLVPARLYLDLKLTWDQSRLTTSVIHAASQMDHPSPSRMNLSRPERSPSLLLRL